MAWFWEKWKAGVVVAGIPLIGGMVIWVYKRWTAEQQYQPKWVPYVVRSGVESSWEMLIPEYQVGAVVGKDGSVIKAISEKTNAALRFDARGESDCPERDEQHRILRIRGRWDSIQMAELEVRKILSINSLQLKETIFAPRSALGLIIGTHGANIKEMSRSARAGIYVQDTNSDPEKIEIRGKPEAILFAKFQKLIAEKIAWSEKKRLLN